MPAIEELDRRCFAFYKHTI